MKCFISEYYSPLSETWEETYMHIFYSGKCDCNLTIDDL